MHNICHKNLRGGGGEGSFELRKHFFLNEILSKKNKTKHVDIAVCAWGLLSHVLCFINICT